MGQPAACMMENKEASARIKSLAIMAYDRQLSGA
jgi:hypothetical protein